MSGGRRLRHSRGGSGRLLGPRVLAARARSGAEARAVSSARQPHPQRRPSAAAASLLALAGAAGVAGPVAGSSGSPASAGRAFSDLVPWLAILGLLVVVGGVVLLRLRRRIREDSRDVRVGFTLHELREMHARGELTDEEFTRARDALVEGVRRSAGREATERDSA